MPNLVDEMELLYHVYGVRFFVFNDDEWFPPGQARWHRIDALEDELARRGMDPIMSIKCRADDVEEELFRRLQDMGVVRAYVGVESGSDHSLRRMNKHTTVAQNRRALEMLHRVGMLADFGLIFFDPDSTVEDVRANLDFFHAMAGAGPGAAQLRPAWRSTPARRSWSACSARAGSAAVTWPGTTASPTRGWSCSSA